jgi:putative hydrolase of the HAD superfamily
MNEYRIRAAKVDYFYEVCKINSGKFFSPMHLNLAKISNPKSEIRNPKSIKNIIFDFGGVICNIDPGLTKKAFINLGLTNFDIVASITKTSGLFENLEIGTITPEYFRSQLRQFFTNPVTDRQLDEAWNALLLDMPEERIRLLEKLRPNYRIFLLSNSNEIHYLKYVETFRNQFGYPDFNALFEKAYFSFGVGLKKPSAGIFRHVLEKSNLEPSETLFIDDTLVHVEGAENVGIHAYHLALDKGEKVTDLFL